jgi:hypothetical protein
MSHAKLGIAEGGMHRFCREHSLDAGEQEKVPAAQKKVPVF